MKNIPCAVERFGIVAAWDFEYTVAEKQLVCRMKTGAVQSTMNTVHLVGYEVLSVLNALPAVHFLVTERCSSRIEIVWMKILNYLTGFLKILRYHKGKAVPLQAWRGPEGSRKLRFPDFMTTAQDGGKVVSLTHRPPFTPRKYSWYSFLLEAELTQGP